MSLINFLTFITLASIFLAHCSTSMPSSIRSNFLTNDQILKKKLLHEIYDRIGNETTTTSYGSNPDKIEDRKYKDMKRQMEGIRRSMEEAFGRSV